MKAPSGADMFGRNNHTTFWLILCLVSIYFDFYPGIALFATITLAVWWVNHLYWEKLNSEYAEYLKSQSERRF